MAKMTIGEFRVALVREMRSRGLRESWANGDEATTTLLQGRPSDFPPQLGLGPLWCLYVKGKGGMAAVATEYESGRPLDEELVALDADGVRRAADKAEEGQARRDWVRPKGFEGGWREVREEWLRRQGRT